MAAFMTECVEKPVSFDDLERTARAKSGVQENRKKRAPRTLKELYRTNSPLTTNVNGLLALTLWGGLGIIAFLVLSGTQGQTTSIFRFFAAITWIVVNFFATITTVNRIGWWIKGKAALQADRDLSRRSIMEFLDNARHAVRRHVLEKTGHRTSEFGRWERENSQRFGFSRKISGNTTVQYMLPPFTDTMIRLVNTRKQIDATFDAFSPEREAINDLLKAWVEDPTTERETEIAQRTHAWLRALDDLQGSVLSCEAESPPLLDITTGCGTFEEVAKKFQRDSDRWQRWSMEFADTCDPERLPWNRPRVRVETTPYRDTPAPVRIEEEEEAACLEPEREEATTS